MKKLAQQAIRAAGVPVTLPIDPTLVKKKKKKKKSKYYWEEVAHPILLKPLLEQLHL
jgi:hypothetical protein